MRWKVPHMAEHANGTAPTLGQNFRFGYDDVPPAQRMAAIRRAGFDDVMLWWGDEFEKTDGSPRALWRMARAEGLGVRTAHFPNHRAHWLWLPGERGDAYEAQMRRAVEDCGALGIRHLVVHTTRQLMTPEPNEAGVERLGRVLTLCEREGVNIALENTRFLRYNAYLYERLSSPNVKFCFDSGHAHCFTPGEDPLGRFGDKLCTMHLHDNFGPEAGDEHHLMGEGDVDFDALFARLRALQPESYNLESYCDPTSRFWGAPMADYLAASAARLRGQMERAGICA